MQPCGRDTEASSFSCCSMVSVRNVASRGPQSSGGIKHGQKLSCSRLKSLRFINVNVSTFPAQLAPEVEAVEAACSGSLASLLCPVLGRHRPSPEPLLPGRSKTQQPTVSLSRSASTIERPISKVWSYVWEPQRLLSRNDWMNLLRYVCLVSDPCDYHWRTVSF